MAAEVVPRAAAVASAVVHTFAADNTLAFAFVDNIDTREVADIHIRNIQASGREEILRVAFGHRQEALRIRPPHPRVLPQAKAHRHEEK